VSLETLLGEFNELNQHIMRQHENGRAVREPGFGARRISASTAIKCNSKQNARTKSAMVLLCNATNPIAVY
jgi:hypothetical protein